MFGIIKIRILDILFTIQRVYCQTVGKNCIYVKASYDEHE